MEKKTKSIGVMTSDQAIQLRQLAFDAYEPDAFSPELDPHMRRKIVWQYGTTGVSGAGAFPSRTAWRFLFWTQIVRRNL